MSQPGAMAQARNILHEQISDEPGNTDVLTLQARSCLPDARSVKVGRVAVNR